MNPKFSVKKLPLKETLGEKLMSARKAKGFDYRYVEEVTKIRAKYLTFLEAGDYKSLPPDVYIRGFLRNYAVLLGLDADRIIRMYIKERGLEENVERATGNKVPKPMKAPKVIITPKTLLISIISTTVLLVVAYIGWQVTILAAPPKLEVFAPAENVTVETDSLIIEGKADEGADIYINDVLVGGGPEGDFKEKVSLQDGVNNIIVVATNKMGKEMKVERSVVAKLKPVEVVPAEIQGVELTVNAGPNSAWVYVEIDGAPVDPNGIVMLSGSSRVFKGAEKVTLTTKNAGSTNVTFNGKDVGALGREGEKITDREFTKDMQIK